MYRHPKVVILMVLHGFGHFGHFRDQNLTRSRTPPEGVIHYRSRFGTKPHVGMYPMLGGPMDTARWVSKRGPKGLKEGGRNRDSVQIGCLGVQIQTSRSWIQPSDSWIWSYRDLFGSRWDRGITSSGGWIHSRDRVEA